MGRCFCPCANPLHCGSRRTPVDATLIFGIITAIVVVGFFVGLPLFVLNSQYDEPKRGDDY